MTMMKDQWFPFVTKNIKAKHGWDTFYYGNVAGGGRRGAAPGGPRRRRHGGRASPPPPQPAPSAPARPARVGDLRARAPLPQQLRRDAQPLRALERGLRLRDVRGSHQGHQLLHGRGAGRSRTSTPSRSRSSRPTPTRNRSSARRSRRAPQIKTGGLIDILMGEVEDEPNPINGAVMNRRKNVVIPEKMTDRLWFEPSATEVVGTEYYVPGERHEGAGAPARARHPDASGDAAGQRRRAVCDHGQHAASGHASSIDTGSHGLRTLQGDWQPAADATVPAGALGRADEPAARAARVLPARADVRRRPHGLELPRRPAAGREGVPDIEKEVGHRGVAGRERLRVSWTCGSTVSSATATSPTSGCSRRWRRCRAPSSCPPHSGTRPPTTRRSRSATARPSRSRTSSRG